MKYLFLPCAVENKDVRMLQSVHEFGLNMAPLSGFHYEGNVYDSHDLCTQVVVAAKAIYGRAMTAQQTSNLAEVTALLQAVGKETQNKSTLWLQTPKQSRLMELLDSILDSCTGDRMYTIHELRKWAEIHSQNPPHHTTTTKATPSSGALTTPR